MVTCATTQASRGARQVFTEGGADLSVSGGGMGITDWNWLLATDLQDYPWDCSACSTAWCTRTVGYSLTENDMIAALGPSRISPSLGLLDASGYGLTECLAEIGITSEYDGDASFDEVLAAAGYQPMVIGGRAWCHWVAVRMGGPAIERADLRMLALMNPAPGYMAVEQTLSEQQFEALGPFSAVWFTAW